MIMEKYEDIIKQHMEVGLERYGHGLRTADVMGNCGFLGRNGTRRSIGLYDLFGRKYFTNYKSKKKDDEKRETEDSN